ncbi:MAG TPA: putative cytokinetic ring protein SteA [Mycobacteriales bacterium]|nr:putative cytokinetic ring protein SteA [Mycobacteriales bacterium]
MRLALRRRTDTTLPGVAGVARVDRRADALLPRLRRGDIAVLDQVDLDRATADALVAAEVAGVVNASPCISGRYPTLGPEILVNAGLPVLDAVGADVFRAVKDGMKLRLDGDTLYAGTGEDAAVLAEGRPQSVETVAASLMEAKAGLATQLEAFAADTMEYMKRERTLLLDGVGVPEIETRIEGRHVLVVARGYDYREDLVSLRHYIREFKPVLVGVDGGAEVLVEAGYEPDLIVGDLQTVSDEVLRAGAEVVVRADPDGRAPALERVQDIGVRAVAFPSAGRSEDVALLLADAHGAELVVTVGMHATLLEFLDRGLSGTASTFLVRLKLGGTLVDAKAASRLHRSRISGAALLLLIFVTLVAVGVILALAADGRAWTAMAAGWWDDAYGWVTGLVR